MVTSCMQKNDKHNKKENELYFLKGWNDYQLKWKPEKYGGIQTIRVPPNQVWTPDVKQKYLPFLFKVYLKEKSR